MGLLSALLTGGSIIGKICQGLSGAFGGVKAINVDNSESEVYDADLKVGGATFYCQKDKKDEQFQPYIFNPTSYPISCSMPNIGSTGGMELLIKPKSSMPFSAATSANIPPDTQVLIGPVSPESSGDCGVMEDTAIKTTLRDLNFRNEPVMIGDLTVSADYEKKLLTVSDCHSAIGNITYFWARSEKGVEAEIRDVIRPIEDNVAIENGMRRNFTINFKDLGFSEEDKLSCRLYFSVHSGNELRIEALSRDNVAPPACYLSYALAKYGETV